MEYYWIGWCRDEKHDKIWGMIDLRGDEYFGTYIAFWGRRGKKLQTKIHYDFSEDDARRLCNSKELRGYQEITNFDEVYPEFEQDLEKTAVWSMLAV
jgi:predicted DNA-binding WGR domain protein